MITTEKKRVRKQFSTLQTSFMKWVFLSCCKTVSSSSSNQVVCFKVENPTPYELGEEYLIEVKKIEELLLEHGNVGSQIQMVAQL